MLSRTEEYEGRSSCLASSENVVLSSKYCVRRKISPSYLDENEFAILFARDRGDEARDADGDGPEREADRDRDGDLSGGDADRARADLSDFRLLPGRRMMDGREGDGEPYGMQSSCWP